jgi:hypothetical protein
MLIWFWAGLELFSALTQPHGRPQTFFQGRAKISREGKNLIFCLKNNKKDTILIKKVMKYTIFGQPGGDKSPP